MFWLTKLHKTPNRVRSIANSSSCTTTQLSVHLKSCLTGIKEHTVRYCRIVFETTGKNFWYIKISDDVLKNLKSLIIVRRSLCLPVGILHCIFHSLIVKKETRPPDALTCLQGENLKS